MKLSIFFYQENSSYNVNVIDSNIHPNDVDSLVSSAVHKLYKVGQTCKVTGAKLFAFNKPIDLLVEVDGKQVFNTAEVSEAFRTKLKFQRTKKGAQRFAVKTLAIVKEALDTFEVKTSPDQVAEFIKE